MTNNKNEKYEKYFIGDNNTEQTLNHCLDIQQVLDFLNNNEKEDVAVRIPDRSAEAYSVMPVSQLGCESILDRTGLNSSIMRRK